MVTVLQPEIAFDKILAASERWDGHRTVWLLLLLQLTNDRNTEWNHALLLNLNKKGGLTFIHEGKTPQKTCVGCEFTGRAPFMLSFYYLSVSCSRVAA